MNSILNKRKAMLLSSLLALGLMLPTGAAAQQSGLFEHQDFGTNGPVGDFTHQGYGSSFMGAFSHQAFGSGFTGDFGHQAFGSNFSGDFSHQGFGNEAPTGSGLLVLTAAGAVYALRRRKDKQQNNE